MLDEVEKISPAFYKVSEEFSGVPKEPGDDEKAFIDKLLQSNVKYDNKKAKDIILSVAKKTGLSPEMLSASALQEGMNLAIRKPDEVSEAYVKAKIGGDYPVDGFYNYGLDRFSEEFPKLVKKGYLPNDFDYKEYSAKNEKNQDVRTAAFRTNEDALMAKAALIKDMADNVKNEAGKKGVKLDDSQLQYFTLANYNGGFGSVKAMFDEMKAAGKSVEDYISGGSKVKYQVHKNVSDRMDKIKYLSEVFKKLQDADGSR